MKEPLVLEFLGLDEKASYCENDLEQAIINRLEHFLLELGKGFLFEARQKRFTFDEDHYFVDLVFYNLLLLCKSAKKTVVELTLPKDANIHAREYQLYLPSQELLKQKLDEWSAAVTG